MKLLVCLLLSVSLVSFSMPVLNGDEINMQTTTNRTSLQPDGRSKLYPENWKPLMKDNYDRYLHDFSYAGYHMGIDSIPLQVDGVFVDVTKPPYNADKSGAQYVQDIIQRALDDVGQAGGGVVFLPEGTYKLKPQTDKNYCLNIKYSNVVLRGAGTGQTYIYNTESDMREKKIIYISDGNDWTMQEDAFTELVSDCIDPTIEIPVADCSKFNIGDSIVLGIVISDEFVAEHNCTSWWSYMVGRNANLFYRKIEGIDRERNILKIDIPLRYYLKTRDNAFVYKANEPMSESGVERFSIGNKESTLLGLDMLDFDKPGTAGYSVHNSMAISFKGVANCWARNINTYVPEGNNGTHILSKGIVMENTRNITVDNCRVSNPQYLGEGGNGYAFQSIGNDNLVTNCVADNARHSFTLSFMNSNGNVFYNNTSNNGMYLSDFHMHLSMANLFDSTILNGDSIDAAIRPWGGPYWHAVTTTQSVIWNTLGTKPNKSTSFIVESKQHGWGYVIGTKGAANKVNTANTIVPGGGGAPIDSAPEDYVEGEGEGERLVPQSLYLDQLSRRKSADSTYLNPYKPYNILDVMINHDDMYIVYGNLEIPAVSGITQNRYRYKLTASNTTSLPKSLIVFMVLYKETDGINSMENMVSKDVMLNENQNALPIDIDMDVGEDTPNGSYIKVFVLPDLINIQPYVKNSVVFE